ncbi:MAG: sulfatase-like hydrolase/transferase [Myxococcales bacterium]|nr:sulfatase-like hydrolase/transferase [Myxococcales bacterium]
MEQAAPDRAPSTRRLPPWLRAALPSRGESGVIAVAALASAMRALDVRAWPGGAGLFGLLGATGAVALLVVVAFAVTSWAGKAGWPRALRLWFFSFLAYAFFYGDAVQYRLYMEHLSGETFELLVQSAAHGELGDGQGGDAVWELTGVGGILLIASLLIEVLRRRKGIAVHRDGTRKVGLAMAILGAATFLTAFHDPTEAAARERHDRFFLAQFLPEPTAAQAGLPKLPKGTWDRDREAWVDCLAAKVPTLEKTAFKAERKPDVFIFHVESLRFDALSAENMPKLFARLGYFTSLPAHFSTGTQTGSGAYGIVSGLPSYLYPFARKASLMPIPLTVFQSLGYDMSVRSSYKLNYDRLDRFFEGTAEHIWHPSPNRSFVKSEREMVDRLSDELRKDSGTGGRTPRFEYVMFYSTHYGYFYPDEFEKFTPVVPLTFEITSRPRDNKKYRGMKESLHNRYRNAALYVDTLIASVLDTLEELGRLDSSIVIVTGDHGEEFWEMGRFGHTFGLNRYQTQVPALVHFPKAIAPGHSVSSHADLFPIIFDAIGLSPSASSFTGGQSLLRPPPAERLVLASRGHLGATVSRDHVLVTPRPKLLLDDRKEVRAKRAFGLDGHTLGPDEMAKPDLQRPVARLLHRAKMGVERCAGGPRF